jgi:hypothetical protein
MLVINHVAFQVNDAVFLFPYLVQFQFPILKPSAGLTMGDIGSTIYDNIFIR